MALSARELSWRENRLEMIRRYEEEEKRQVFIDEGQIWSILEKTSNPQPSQVREVLAKAKELKGLTPEETGILINTTESRAYTGDVRYRFLDKESGLR